MDDDPLQRIIDFVRYWWKRLILTLMNEEVTISPGESMTIPNEVEPLHIYFERLETEPDPRRVAQLNRRYRERKLQKQLVGTVQFCATLLASSNYR